jgi:hypothetical protein
MKDRSDQIRSLDMFRHPTVSAMVEFLSAAQPQGIYFTENIEQAAVRRVSAQRLRQERKQRQQHVNP